MDEKLVAMAKEAAVEVVRAEAAQEIGKSELAGFRIGLSIAKSLAVFAQVMVTPEREVTIDPEDTGEGYFEVTINGEPKMLQGPSVDYESVVVLAYGKDASGTNPSVTYKKGLVTPREGVLRPGQRVRIHSGMSFSAYYTGNA